MKTSSMKIWRAGSLVYTTAGLVALFCWLLWGDFAWAMKDRAIGPAATLLFRSFNSNDFLYSLIIISFPNFTNIFLMPVISYISDRHRGRWGRRIPFLAFTTPFIVIGAGCLGFSPWLGQHLFEILNGALSHSTCCIVCFGVFWAILDFGATLAGALSGALINDVVPKEMLGRFYGLFRAVSLLAGILFNYYLMGKIEDWYFYIFPCVGLLYGIGLTCLCLKVKEGEYPPLPPEPAEDTRGLAMKIFGPVITYFRQCFSNRFYVLVMVALVFGMLAGAPYNMYSIFYAKCDAIQMNMDVYGKILAQCYCVSFILSFPLGMMADRFHPLRTSIASVAVYFAVMIAGWFMVGNLGTFTVFFYLHTIISGCYGTLSASLAQRLFPYSLFAQFNSAMQMVLAVTNVLLGIVCGKILVWLHSDYHYVFVFGGFMSLIGLLALARVFVLFKKMGGDAGYVAPDPDAAET